MAYTKHPVVYTLWVGACELPAIYYNTGTWTATRTSAGIYYMLKTATAETSVVEFPLSRALSRFFAGGSPGTTFPQGQDTAVPNPFRGIRLESVTSIYGIGVANLTTHSVDIIKTQYGASGGAPTVTTAAGGTLTGTPLTAFGTIRTTGLYTTTYTLPAPILINPDTNVEGIYFQDTLVAAASTTIALDGVFFNVSVMQ